MGSAFKNRAARYGHLNRRGSRTLRPYFLRLSRVPVVISLIDEDEGEPDLAIDAPPAKLFEPVTRITPGASVICHSSIAGAFKPHSRGIMTKNAVVLAFGGLLAVCVIGLGFAGQFQPADLHEYDFFAGIPLAAAAVDCNDHGASVVKPITLAR